MAQKPPPLSDQIRKAVDASGMSRYRIAKEIGLSQSMMSRFMSGQFGVSMAVADKLGELLGLEIVASQPKVKGSKVKHGQRSE